MRFKTSGFTLIELMVTVAVAVISLTVAVPTFIDLLRANKMTTQVNNFIQALHTAHKVAESRGGAALCASDDQSQCTGTDLQDGWIIFEDSNTNGTVEAGEDILRVGDALPVGFKIIPSGKSTILFASRGFLTPPGILTYTFCNKRIGVGAGRTVTINNTGRPTVSPYDDCK